MAASERNGIQIVDAVLDWLDYDGDRNIVLAQLAVYHDWLATEALTAGGIGPAELTRLWSRHIADSLAFLSGLGDEMIHSETDIVDVGSGVGLPGIPLAITLPEVGFTLLDRSGKRCALARRALRVLDLDNVEVMEADARRVTLPYRAGVARAVRSPRELVPTFRRLLPSGRVAVVGGSRRAAPPASDDFAVIEVPVLGENTWLAKIPLSG